MKIKQYIVTYNNDALLSNCLASMNGVSHEITIIDNFGNCAVDTLGLNVTIIKNSLRPPFSTGHLAKDWNSALVLGFKNLHAPDADIVILNQGDMVFKTGYVDTLKALHKRYDFVQMGSGDEMMSFTPAAIRKVGLFDERFSNIGFQEADYFLRARIYNPERTSINDITHDRCFNLLGKNEIAVESTTCGHDRQDISTVESAKYHTNSAAVFFHKWHNLPLDRNWSKLPPNFSFESVQPVISYIMYPYFEKDIDTLKAQRFVHYFE